VGLVVDVDGDGAELLAVRAGVVSAEEQLSTLAELDAQVGLGSATVAAVARGQRGGAGGNCSGHIGLFPWVVVLVFVFIGTYSNLAAGANIPRGTVRRDVHPITLSCTPVDCLHICVSPIWEWFVPGP